MPNLRASYEAEAMMPRFSPPTATGLPRKRASAACSTEAKKASASRWTIERCKQVIILGTPKLQAPSSKLQRSTKLQTSTSARIIWSLGFDVSMELGAWRLELSFPFPYQWHHHSLSFG